MDSWNALSDENGFRRIDAYGDMQELPHQSMNADPMIDNTWRGRRDEK